jgi:hypothetical protein|tara:strand:+ start:3154 stop:3660 length:507 start_codon:yes stop_codon:yes gene_type:complete
VILCSLPAYAEPETQITSAPTSQAVGTVNNQAVQFQNNGAPSRQQFRSGTSCNGATMTFSPFYMGNDTVPMDSEGYVKNNNWGAQLNFMIPLDGSMIEQCKSVARRIEQRQRLDYILLRSTKCAALQKDGFTFRPGSRYEALCNDIVPIVSITDAVTSPDPVPDVPPL